MIVALRIVLFHRRTRMRDQSVRGIPRPLPSKRCRGGLWPLPRRCVRARPGWWHQLSGTGSGAARDWARSTFGHQNHHRLHSNSSLYSPLKLALKAFEGVPHKEQIDHDIGGEAVGHTADRAEQVRGGNGDRVHSSASLDPSATNIEVPGKCATRACLRRSWQDHKLARLRGCGPLCAGEVPDEHRTFAGSYLVVSAGPVPFWPHPNKDNVLDFWKRSKPPEGLGLHMGYGLRVGNLKHQRGDG